MRAVSCTCYDPSWRVGNATARVLLESHNTRAINEGSSSSEVSVLPGPLNCPDGSLPPLLELVAPCHEVKACVPLHAAGAQQELCAHPCVIPLCLFGTNAGVKVRHDTLYLAC